MTDKTNHPQTIEIRKYPNRRYYDKAQSRHLTLEDIRLLIQEGADVRIVDSQSGADITSKVLTQIILEFDSPKLDLLTAPLLTQMIRVNDQVMKGFFEKFFSQAVASFFAFQRQLEKQLREGQVLPRLFPGFAPWFEPTPSHEPPPEEGREPAPNAAPNAHDIAASVQQLQKELKSLRQEVHRRPRRPTSGKK